MRLGPGLTLRNGMAVADERVDDRGSDAAGSW
jgi:hypothetical protein